MPQIVRAGKFQVMIYTEDHGPAHVHVRFDACSVRVLISADGVELHLVRGRAKDMDVRRALELCLAKWKEIHG